MDKVVKEKFKSLKKALKLQATEYQRRLYDLNHENERIKEVQKDSIPREVFDRVISEINLRLERILNDRITPLEAYKTKQEGSLRVIMYLIGVVIAIVIGVAIKVFSGK